jgi:two-component system, OmpR family, sensor histidine kinase KdpD
VGWIFSIVIVSWMMASVVEPVIGYESIGILFLMVVTVSGLFFSRFSILLLAICLSLVHNFFFIPPLYTFAIKKPQDALMAAMFFLAATAIGHLTSRLARQRTLNEKREQLEQAQKLYRSLFDSVSHELNTPLTTIKGAASALTEAHQTPPEFVHEMSDQIGHEADRLSALVHNMLDMSRLESGMLQPKMAVADVADVLGPTLTRLQVPQGMRSLRTHIDPKVHSLYCDGTLLTQALTNIVSNAVAYTETNGTIDIFVRNNQAWVEIIVQDNGPGLPPEPSLVFNRFYRSRPERSGGVGLGLSIAKGFVEAQGGQLVARNRPEGGAEFNLRIIAHNIGEIGGA